jgi:rubredoxin
VAAKRFSCLECGKPFDAFPPDDMHNVASRNQNSYEDNIKVDYTCENCAHVNTIYWGHQGLGISVA